MIQKSLYHPTLRLFDKVSLYKIDRNVLTVRTPYPHQKHEGITNINGARLSRLLSNFTEQVGLE
jgi:hypothetical protein